MATPLNGSRKSLISVWRECSAGSLVSCSPSGLQPAFTLKQPVWRECSAGSLVSCSPSGLQPAFTLKQLINTPDYSRIIHPLLPIVFPARRNLRIAATHSQPWRRNTCSSDMTCSNISPPFPEEMKSTPKLYICRRQIPKTIMSLNLLRSPCKDKIL